MTIQCLSLHSRFVVKTGKPSSLLHESIRMYSTESKTFSHLDEKGKVKMVDVSSKATTERTATATAKVRLDQDIISKIQEGNMKKGDVIATAKIAGIVAAKRTSFIIPLCHQINLTHIDICIDLEDDFAHVVCKVKTRDRTGVEMEALTGVTVSCLTLYDMVKSMKKDIVIQDIQVVSKTGGKTDF